MVSLSVYSVALAEDSRSSPIEYCLADRQADVYFDVTFELVLPMDSQVAIM